MKAIFEAVISRGGYDLDDMLRKIAEQYVDGRLSAQDRDNLIRDARAGAKQQVDAGDEIGRLWEAIRAMDGRLAALEGGSQSEAWPAWHQPTGAHDAYFRGDRMTYTDGVRYACTAPEGVACAWSPDVMPDYWQAEV